ncbi:MAG: hypothetical protein KDJ75_09870 [Alphaproteobacteria bacterium]|nr:hypothetical protein [Alphaproteobacteria bacterium]
MKQNAQTTTKQGPISYGAVVKSVGDIQKKAGISDVKISGVARKRQKRGGLLRAIFGAATHKTKTHAVSNITDLQKDFSAVQALQITVQDPQTGQTLGDIHVGANRTSLEQNIVDTRAAEDEPVIGDFLADVMVRIRKSLKNAFAPSSDTGNGGFTTTHLGETKASWSGPKASAAAPAMA